LICFGIAQEIELAPVPKKSRLSAPMSPVIASGNTPVPQIESTVSGVSMSVGVGSVSSRLSSGGNLPEHISTPRSAVSTPVGLPTSNSSVQGNKIIHVGSSVSVTSTPMQNVAKIQSSNILSMSQPTKVSGVASYN